MKRDFVRSIYECPESYSGKEVTLGGWVRNLRDSKAFGFIDLNDGSCHKNVQVVFEREKINNYASPLLGENVASLPLEIECEVSFSDLDEEGVEEILELEPFGLSNPQPVFILRDVKLHDVVPLSQGKHVRFRACRAENGRNMSLNAVCFGTPFDRFGYCEGDVCDIVFTVDMNEYLGFRSPQLFIKAITLSRSEENSVRIADERLEMLVSGKNYENSDVDVPDLSDFRSVFRYLRREAGSDGKTVSLISAVRILENEFEIPVTLCKLKIILEVLKEQNLLSAEYNGDRNTVFLKMIPSSGKINIDDSPLLSKIRESARKE